MSIKIKSLKPQAPKQPRDRASRKADLWRIISRDEILSKFIRSDHPFFQFEPLSCSESLSFRVSVRGLPQSVTALAFAVDLKGEMTVINEEKHFQAGVLSAIRTLLFEEISGDDHNQFVLIDSKGIDYGGIVNFLLCSTENLPLNVRFEGNDAFLDAWLERAYNGPDFAPMRLRFSKSHLERYAQGDADTLIKRMEMVQDYLMIYLSRALLLNMATPEQLKQRQSLGDDVQDNIQSALGILRASGSEPVKAPTLALCMIVKDGADTLADCLKSVQGLVDEIIVVDTGSSDDSKEIAASFGAKVFYHPWQDSFADARNAALDKVTADWVLVLDADEALTGGHDVLKQLINIATGDMVYALKVVNLGPDGTLKESVIGYSPRLFNRANGYRYTGIIHEQLQAPDGAFPASYALTETEVLHVGYTEEKMPAKRERNFNLMKAAIAENPNDPFQWFNFGVGCREAGDQENAVMAFFKCLSLLPESLEGIPYASAAIACLVGALVDLKRYSEAIDICLVAPIESLNSPDLLLARGWALLGMGQAHDAVRAFGTAIGCKTDVIVSDTSASTWKPLLGLYHAHKMLGEHSMALAVLNEAVLIAPEHPHVLDALRIEKEAACGIIG